MQGNHARKICANKIRESTGIVRRRFRRAYGIPIDNVQLRGRLARAAVSPVWKVFPEGVRENYPAGEWQRARDQRD